MTICLVHPDYLDPLIPQLEPLLASAVAHNNGEHTTAQVIDQLRRGEMHLVVEVEDGKVRSAVVLSVVEYPNQRTINVVYGAGRNVRRLLPMVREVAKAVGAKAIETYTRPEVAVLYRRAGFRQAYVVSRLELDDA